VAVSFIGAGNRSTRRKPLTCRKSLTNMITMLYRVHLEMNGFELITLVVIGTDCAGSCISNYIRSRPQWPLVCLSIASTIAFVYCSFTPLSPCFCYIVAEWWMKREYIHTWIFVHFLLTDKVKELAMTQQIACIFACDSRIMAGMGIWWDMLLHQPVGNGRNGYMVRYGTSPASR
jgi:hypothetical protein